MDTTTDLKELRMARNLTVRQAAQALDCSPSVLCKLENRRTSTSLQFANRLADFYGVTLDDIAHHIL